MVKKVGDKGEGEGKRERVEGVFVPERQRSASGKRGDRHIGKWWFIKVKKETPCQGELFNFKLGVLIE